MPLEQKPILLSCFFVGSSNPDLLPAARRPRSSAARRRSRRAGGPASSTAGTSSTWAASAPSSLSTRTRRSACSRRRARRPAAPPASGSSSTSGLSSCGCCWVSGLAACMDCGCKEGNDCVVEGKTVRGGVQGRGGALGGLAAVRSERARGAGLMPRADQPAFVTACWSVLVSAECCAALHACRLNTPAAAECRVT